MTHVRDGASDERRHRQVLKWLALPYLLFVVYGSLVPLHFTPIAWDQAVLAYSNMPFARYSPDSRLDWAVNVMLFVPLAFIWFGLLDSRPECRVWRVPLVVALASVLAAGIEFTQLWFPPRVTALNDIIAESAGAGIGIALWIWRGRTITAHAVGWAVASHHHGRWTSAFYAYLGLLFLYNLMPLDLTVSLHEIWDKWRDQRILVLPFQYRGPFTDAVIGWIVDVVAWVPVGVLALVARVGRPMRLWLACIAIAALLEGLQLFVFSRVSDFTDVLTAAMGTGIGLRAGFHFGVGTRGLIAENEHEATARLLGRPVWWAGAFGYSLLLLVVFWYPFDFRVDAAFAHDRLLQLSRLPFYGLLSGGEFQAIGNLLQKSGLYIPLGLMLGRCCKGLHRPQFGMAALVTIAWALALPAGIELGQLLLPEKFPDPSDCILAAVGLAIGASLVRALPNRAPLKPGTGKHRRFNWRLSVAWAGISVVIALATRLPGVPYNVREALDPRAGFLAPAVCAAFLLWIAFLPVWAPRLLRPGRAGRGLCLWPLLLAGHAIIAYALLQFAVTRETMEDIVGSPILHWPDGIELFARGCTLIAATTWLLLGGALFAAQSTLERSRRQAVALWLTLSLAMLPIFHWTIFTQAATDNLTELVAGDAAPWATGLIAVWFVGLGATAARIMNSIRTRSVLRGVTLVGLSVILGFLLVNLATATAIVKYGATFSALQFLLSPDREHYADTATLLMRYSFLHVGLVVGLAVCFASFGRQDVDSKGNRGRRRAERKPTTRRPDAPE